MSEFEGLAVQSEQSAYDFISSIDEDGKREVAEEKVVEPVEQAPVQDAVEETVEEVVQPEIKTPYTAEEIKVILREGQFESIDTSRLSEEGQLVMKSFQSGLTPKLQEAAELKKELERLRKDVESSKPKAEPKDIYEAYDQNPKDVNDYLDKQLLSLDPSDPEQKAQFVQMLNLKQELQQRGVTKFQEQFKSQQEVQKVMSEVVKLVPDIAQKEQELAKFAVEVMGFSQEELMSETNPSVAGMNAAKTIARINAAYEKFNAAKTLGQKKAKSVPTKVEQPGTGFKQEAPDWRSQIKDVAKKGKTQDWANLLIDLPE